MLQRGPVDIAEWPREKGGAFLVRTVEETRAFGWPKKSVVVNGIFRDSMHANQNALFGDTLEEWWSNGLGARVGDLRRSPARDRPALGLAWKPVWPLFLLNTLILGVPLSVVVLAVSRTVDPNRRVGARGE